MGAGKSTVGPLLAARLGWRFLDVDDVIEAEAGAHHRRTLCAAWRSGLPGPRTCDHCTAGAEDALVLALGGGAIEHADTRDLLLTTPGTLLVHLEVELATTLARCAARRTSARSWPTRPTSPPATATASHFIAPHTSPFPLTAYPGAGSRRDLARLHNWAERMRTRRICRRLVSSCTGVRRESRPGFRSQRISYRFMTPASQAAATTELAAARRAPTPERTHACSPACAQLREPRPPHSRSARALQGQSRRHGAGDRLGRVLSRLDAVGHLQRAAAACWTHCLASAWFQPEQAR